MNPKTIAIGAALMMMALMALPTAMAQTQIQTSFAVQKTTLSSDEPIRPDTGSVTVTLDWIYTINFVAVGPVAGTLTGTATLKWTSVGCENPNVVITGSLAQLVPFTAEPGGTTTITGQSTFLVTVTQDAPGETPIKCDFTGKVESPFVQVPETSEATGTTTIKAEYLGLISASVPITIKQAGPQKQIRYDITVTNLGNARTYVNFKLQNEEPGKGGWQPVPPLQLVLQSEAQGGQEITGERSFLVSTPFKNGWNNKETTFLLDITPSSAKDPEDVGQTQTLAVLARVRGVYIPTLEPILLAGAVLGMALLARRRTDE